MFAEKEEGRHFTGRLLWLTAALLTALAVLVVLSVLTGSAGLGAETGMIVYRIRLPRIAAAVLLGGALSVSGYLLQTFFHNPIAGPYVLGISSGAKLAVAVVLILLMGWGLVPGSAVLILAALFGSLVVMGFVLLVSVRVSGMAVLVVCGVMAGYICSALCEFLITFADDANIIDLHNWSMGSFSGITWRDDAMAAVVVFAAMVLVLFLAKPMGAYLAGEEYAASVGVNIRLFRLFLILTSSLLAATVTAFAGPISFVGIAVPHLIRQTARVTRPLVLIPLMFLGGAVFCLLCDLIARTLFAPTELSVSSVTAVFGAPVVLSMLVRKGER